MDGGLMACLREPDSEVVPGVRWGRPEQVPSPAFWAALARDADEASHGYVDRDSTLEESVGFCLLGGYGITAELNHAAFVRLRDVGAFHPPGLDEDQILGHLRAPLDVGRRRVRYRFPAQRAHRLAVAMDMLGDIELDTQSPLEVRRSLMTIPGIGPKTASWIVRNWLGSDDVAILDIHIVRACQVMRLFGDKVSLPRDYEVLERRFLDFAHGLGVRASLLDALMWREMRELRPRDLGLVNAFSVS
ncbi:hypothetical protein D3869_18150 (plasmid) [Azospirillum brasilense]|uniref:HhH-GPD domain-containing protein n=1 Tax=Azospirillum brasilense TaxID=192 RepID=A0A4D8R6M0_AZOBR|nr:hypothetical protein [Azospirillum brasilense]QCO17184.1 hypothetical protein D3869_18150 [Azospirillum brasilense]